MATASLTNPMIRFILAAESSPLRFEAFCIELYGGVDSRTYVGTSANYDRGRDAKAVDLADGEHAPVICTSLRKDVIDKAKEDASILFKYASPRFVRFCSNQEFTEKINDHIELIFRQASKEVQTVICNSLRQLVDLASLTPQVVEKHYPGEVANLRSALAVTESDAELVQLTGMRIALTTQLGGDATALREDVQRNLVLTALADGQGRTPSALCSRISQLLHLSRPTLLGYLDSTIKNLALSGHIKQDSNNRYLITDTGKAELRSRTEQGSQRLGEGQKAVKAALQELCGQPPESEEFAQLWNVFQDSIANMFLANGIYIVESVTSIIDGKTAVKDHPNLQESVDALANKVAGLGIWGARGDEMAQAIRDMFHDHASGAFAWLADLCLVYVSTCSLGLEPHSQDQILARLRELDLLLDTDVVLSFLCKGEPNHNTIVDVINAWKQINGNVYVSPPVLEETAYHAHIAPREYDDVWRRLDKMDDRAAQRLINNAFVRGFRIDTEGRFERKRWGLYISQFCGKKEYDFEKVQSLLIEDGIGVLNEGNVDTDLVKMVAETLIANRSKADKESDQLPPNYRDKCDRDGRLVGILDCHRRTRAQLHGSGIIISSSSLLRKACRQLGSRLGLPEPVLPVGALAYLLSLVPGVKMSLASLRGVLFDVEYGSRLPPLDRLLMRILDASEEYMVPFARRARLRPIMRDKIGRLAKERGQSFTEIVAQAQAGDETIVKDFAGAVAAAVDTIAKSEAEKQLERTKRK